MVVFLLVGHEKRGMSACWPAVGNRL